MTEQLLKTNHVRGEVIRASTFVNSTNLAKQQDDLLFYADKSNDPKNEEEHAGEINKLKEKLGKMLMLDSPVNKNMDKKETNHEIDGLNTAIANQISKENENNTSFDISNENLIYNDIFDKKDDANKVIDKESVGNKDEKNEGTLDDSVKNMLDANAFAMYQNRMNKTDETPQEDHKTISLDDTGIELKSDKPQTKVAKVVSLGKKPALNAERKMSLGNGLIGVIAAGQKKKSTNKKFGFIAKHVTKLPEKVLYARNNKGCVIGSRIPVKGGVPVTEELATELRTVAFGSSGCPPRGEWIRTPLTIRPPSQPLAYGLSAPRNGCRGLLAALGAHILKYILFGAERPKDAHGKYLQTDLLLRPDEIHQQDALVLAISEVIWRASGDTKKAYVAIPQEIVYVQHSHVYYQDTVTERLHIFEFHNLEDVQIFVKRYLYVFDEEPGCGTLLLLYSCMLSRGLQNIKNDLDNNHSYLVSSQVEGSINVVMLLLTGRATPYLHNGVIYVGDEDHYALPQYGVLARSSIGLLEWKGSEDNQDSERQPPGSRLKTPALPIWVTFYAGHYGMLFNTNRELLRNYHAERRFDLHYYTCGGCYVFLSVDTRALNDGGSSSKDDINATPLEKLIHSKWQEAKISWTGQTPYVGEMVMN